MCDVYFVVADDAQFFLQTTIGYASTTADHYKEVRHKPVDTVFIVQLKMLLVKLNIQNCYLRTCLEGKRR